MLGPVFSEPQTMLSVFLSELLAVPLMMVVAAATVVTYAELRGHEHHGLGAIQLADELEPARQIG